MSDNNKYFIHPTAIVDPEARIGSESGIGPFSIIEKGVTLGNNTRVHSHVLIADGTRLGDNCTLHKGAVVGTVPQDLKFHNEKTELIVGDRTMIREYCTLNRGTAHGGCVTRVGSDCLLMAYVHVAHDCMVGNNVILANTIDMAGHVIIEDFVTIGGQCVIHQFVRIGEHSYIGGHSRVAQDVPPYILTTGGEKMQYFGPNVVGLRRRGFKASQLNSIKRVYHFIYRENMNLAQAVDAIKSDMEITEEVQVILDFIDHSERGLMGR